MILAMSATPPILEAMHRPSATDRKTCSPRPLREKVSLRELEAARRDGRALAMLTCYDFTTATVMQRLGVPLLLVGDSAAVTILGYDSTVHIRQPILQELTAAVRRGAPLAYLVADMPFGSYHASEAQAIENVCEMVRATGCDAVKLEVTPRQARLVEKLSDAGVAVWAHLGLRPQSAQRLGYRTQGRSAAAARKIVRTALSMQESGAVAVLLEAVPPEVGEAVVDATKLPVIGCGAGPACTAHVVVLQDLLGLTPHQPKFVPVADRSSSLEEAIAGYLREIEAGRYPAADHCYSMNAGESARFAGGRRPQDERQRPVER